MLSLLTKLYDYQEREWSQLSFTDDEEAEWKELKPLFIFSCGRNLLPIPVVTTLKPTDSLQFAYHILLSMGSYCTELDILSHRHLREAYIYAGLFSERRPERSIQTLLRQYITEQLGYQPIGSHAFDEYVVAATRTFRSLLVHGNLPLYSLLSCLASKVYCDCSEDIRKHIDALKDQILSVCISRLSPMLQPLLNRIPTSTEVLEGKITEKLRGPMPRGEHQSGESYREQEELRALIRRTIDNYMDPNRTTQSGKIIIVGAPGTGKTFCEFFAILYMYARGLFGIPTSVQGETATAAGGIHDAKLYHLPVHQTRSGHVPYRDAEKALMSIARDPLAVQLHLEMDCEIKEEGEMLNSATWAAEDMIQRAICDSKDYKADKILFSTMDHRQIKPCEGESFFLSPVVLTACTIYRLRYFVRSSQDQALQRFIEIQRMPKSLFNRNRDALLKEF